MVRWLYEWFFDPGLTTILETDSPNRKRRSPSGIGGQFRRVFPVEHNFVESLTSPELVPRERKTKFFALEKLRRPPSPDLEIYIIREECLFLALARPIVTILLQLTASIANSCKLRYKHTHIHTCSMPFYTFGYWQLHFRRVNQFGKYIWKMIDAENGDFISFSVNRKLVFHEEIKLCQIKCQIKTIGR